MLKRSLEDVVNFSQPGLSAFLVCDSWDEIDVEISVS
jgi:hypothetical protein